MTYGIRLNKPMIDEKAESFIAKSLRGNLNGNDKMTRLCEDWLARKAGVAHSLLTASCTDALEMAALLADLKEGDEVIMPSFTFSSTANAVVLRGAVPVFVDVRPDTLNLDEQLIVPAITKKTRAICPVHYAGVGCDMDAIMQIARQYKLFVIEDAAQCFGASYRGKPLGTIGDLGAYSFHSSKVITSGEGGALLINRKKHVKRAEILCEKGTNRTQLLRGEINKYTWVDKGSSFLMSDVSAALLLSQFMSSPQIIRQRLRVWMKYYQALESLEAKDLLVRPTIPDTCVHNGHIFYILLRSKKERDALRAFFGAEGIEASFHYIPLHSSPAGSRFGRTASSMAVTNKVSSTLLRLPVFPQMTEAQQKRVIQILYRFWDLKCALL